MTWKTQPRFNFGQLAAITRGHGPSVVLIHGVGLRAEAWGAQIDALSRTCRICAVDMPGHSESQPLAQDPTLAAFTDAIVEGFDEPSVVIGHSFGAMIALNLAARHPKLVTGVAAMNAIYRRTAESQLAAMARANSLDGETVADPTPTLNRWFGSDQSAERDACDTWLRTVDPIGYRDAYRVFATEDGPVDADLAALDCPAIFLTGSREPNSTPEMSEQMAALAPNGSAKIVADAAHMLPMTHAAEVNAILTKFVSACQ